MMKSSSWSLHLRKNKPSSILSNTILALTIQEKKTFPRLLTTTKKPKATFLFTFSATDKKEPHCSPYTSSRMRLNLSTSATALPILPLTIRAKTPARIIQAMATETMPDRNATFVTAQANAPPARAMDICTAPLPTKRIAIAINAIPTTVIVPIATAQAGEINSVITTG